MKLKKQTSNTDISGPLPVILCEIDKDGDMTNSYVYANSQILAKCDHTGASVEDYFYITDRSGSVRVIADDSGAAQVSYTYDPFGVVSEENGTFANPYKFTGQWYDEEIDQYYLRARMYDPRLMRFIGYDSIRGKYEEPMSLHRFLYCENEPVNRIDLSGLDWTSPDGVRFIGAVHGSETSEWIKNDVINFLSSRKNYGLDFFDPLFEAFGAGGHYDMKNEALHYEYDSKKHRHKKVNDRFYLNNELLRASEFGNYLAGYGCYDYAGLLGVEGAGLMGHWYAMNESRSRGKRLPFDEPGSRYWMFRGALDSNKNWKGLGAFVDKAILSWGVWSTNQLKFLNYVDNPNYDESY